MKTIQRNNKRNRWVGALLTGLIGISIALSVLQPFGIDITLWTRPYGLTSRHSWTVSRVNGTPDAPPPFELVSTNWGTIPGVPTSIKRNPMTDEMIALDQSGRVYRVGPNTQPTLLFDIRDRIHFLREFHGFWDIVFSPDFSNDRQIFVSYDTGPAEAPRVVIVRFNLNSSFGLESPLEIISWPSEGGHKGAALVFDNHGMLYITVGDNGSSTGVGQSYETGQDITDLHGSLLRIDVSGADKDAPYRVPVDNPFIDIQGARPEVWALGLRNPWRMYFDAVSETLWVNDVGEDSWEAVYKIERGANYGWSLWEGGHDFRPSGKRGPGQLTKPFVSHPHTQFRAISGGVVYRGQRFSELEGQYLYADYVTGKIYSVPINATDPSPELVADSHMQIVSMAETPAGEICVLTNTGEIHHLQTSINREANANFPRLLSETGLFRSIRENQMESGVVAYDVNSPLWSDGASKRRYVAIPGKGTATGINNFVFPDGTVFVKTFSLRLDEEDPKSERNIETRLMHLEHGQYHGYSYLWNEDQDEAVLVDSTGDSLDLSIKSANGEQRKQNWQIPSRDQCFVCHTEAANFILGFTVPQLNLVKDYDGKRDNQLRSLANIGIVKGFWTRRHFYGWLPLAAEKAQPRLVDPADVHQPLEKRARSYLHANCGHCHCRRGGGNSAFFLNYQPNAIPELSLETAPVHGSLGVEGAMVVCPGDPNRSMVYRRMTMSETGRMPKLAVSLVDSIGADVVGEWIKSLKPTDVSKR